jgi:diguanylate cyclase (GGDEF)-like protein
MSDTLDPQQVLHRLRAAIASEPIPTRSGPLQITVSIGATQLQPGDQNITDLLARADQALYRAKNEGRNCLRIA